MADTQAVERDREALTSHMVTLTHLQNNANIADHSLAPSRITHENEAEFDNTNEIELEDPAHLPADTNSVPVEDQQVYLPCNGSIADVENLLRKNQASRLLHQLWELVADKSFQYSHIMQAAPRKGVQTQS